MFKKYSFLFLAMPLAGAVAGPLAYFKWFSQGKAPAAATVGSAPISVNGLATPDGTSLPGALAVAASSAVKVHDAASVFSFDITPEWILARWPSVSTGLAQLQLEGYRVPLVTGTGQQDVAGALTYYFGARQKLQRINFVGVSGDSRGLVDLLSVRF